MTHLPRVCDCCRPPGKVGSTAPLSFSKQDSYFRSIVIVAHCTCPQKPVQKWKLVAEEQLQFIVIVFLLHESGKL